jgi:hypothetical protein
MNDAITNRLHALRRHELTVGLIGSLSRVLLLLIGGLACWLVLDRALIVPGMGGGRWDVGMRACASAVLAVVVMRALWRGPIAVVRAQRDDRALAARFEAVHRELDGRLLSVIELRDAPAQRIGSAGLLAALTAQVAALVPQLECRRACDDRPARRLAIMATLALAVALGWAAWKPAVATAMLDRLVLGQASYPTATRIVGVHLPDLIAAGDPVPVEVELDPTAELPSSASVLVAVPGADEAELVLSRHDERGRVRWTGTVQQAVVGMTVQPVAGDHRWPSRIPVAVGSRPTLADLSLRLDFPAYLGLPAASTATGDLRAPAGTRVSLVARADRPLRSAWLDLHTASGAQRIDLSLDATGTTAGGAFPLDHDGTWMISLLGADGLAMSAQPSWHLTALPDAAPQVEVLFPLGDREATSQANYPVHVRASDDHGIAALRLCWQVQSSTGMTTVGGIDAADPATGEIACDLSTVTLTPGDRVVWWVEARDRCQPQANVGRSRRSVFTIVDPVTLREHVRQAQAQLAGQVRALRDTQAGIRAQTESQLRPHGGVP